MNTYAASTLEHEVTHVRGYLSVSVSHAFLQKKSTVSVSHAFLPKRGTYVSYLIFLVAGFALASLVKVGYLGTQGYFIGGELRYQGVLHMQQYQGSPLLTPA